MYHRPSSTNEDPSTNHQIPWEGQWTMRSFQVSCWRITIVYFTYDSSGRHQLHNASSFILWSSSWEKSVWLHRTLNLNFKDPWSCYLTYAYHPLSLILGHHLSPPPLPIDTGKEAYEIPGKLGQRYSIVIAPYFAHSSVALIMHSSNWVKGLNTWKWRKEIKLVAKLFFL